MRRLVRVWGFMLLFLGSAAQAAPKQVRISYMEDASTSVGIAWSTSSGVAEAVVRYGTVKGSYPSSVTGSVTALAPPLGSVSEVVLTGLSPDTIYYYTVGGPQGGFSPEYELRTGPAPHPQCATFSFAVVGDSRGEEIPVDQGASSVWPKIMNQAMANKPDFLLHTGDIIYDGKSYTRWDHHLTVTTPFSTKLPIMYSLGNHDDGTPAGQQEPNYNAALLLPRAEPALGGSATEDFYFFTYGNAIFIVLSTESYTGGSIKFQEQADWMDAVLTQHPARWKFAVLHRPIYTQVVLSNHEPNEVGQNPALVPVFNKHHVDMVFQGHNHWYERYAPTACSDGGSTKPCPVSDFDQGTVYVTSGGGGALLYPFAGFTNPARPAAASVHHHVLLEINHNTLKLTATGIGGKIIDSLTITKAASPTDPCQALPDAGQVVDSGVDLLPSDAKLADGPLPASDARTILDRGGSVTPDASISSGSDGCSCEIGGPAAGGMAWLLFFGILLARRRFRRGGITNSN